MHKLINPEEMGWPLSTFIVMSHTLRHLHNKLENSGGYGDLTRSQFYTLMTLEHQAGMPLSQISERISRSPGNMTLVIDNLEKEGLVERQRSQQDRRVVVAALTESGRQRIEQARRAHRTAVERELSTLTDQELQLLTELFEKINPGLCENAQNQQKALKTES
ncbi:MAG TPA: MarR family transcriptional regulator [Chloroflexi bacterium]|nr:MarR family transcriptional regulator [Chloroflexota bacterium]